MQIVKYEKSSTKDRELIFSKILAYRLYDGWREVFQAATVKGIKIATVSTAKKLINRTLAYFGLDCNVTIGWRRCYQKSHPYLIEMASNKLQIHKEEVISIGDSTLDRQMSHNGGVRFIGAL